MGLVNERLPCTCAAGKPVCKACTLWQAAHGAAQRKAGVHLKIRDVADLRGRLAVVERRIALARARGDSESLKRAFAYRARLRRVERERFREQEGVVS